MAARHEHLEDYITKEACEEKHGSSRTNSIRIWGTIALLVLVGGSCLGFCIEEARRSLLGAEQSENAVGELKSELRGVVAKEIELKERFIKSIDEVKGEVGEVRREQKSMMDFLLHSYKRDSAGSDSSKGGD